MRITGGKFRGRSLSSVVPKGTRPTSEKVRQAAASALAARNAIADAHVLDLFAGTGGYGFEALSRDAAAASFVDCNRRLLANIRVHAKQLEVESQIDTLALDLIQSPLESMKQLQKTATQPFSLVFWDPPYDSALKALEALQILVQLRLLAPNAWLLLEMSKRNLLAPPAFLSDVTTHKYGDTVILLGNVSS